MNDEIARKILEQLEQLNKTLLKIEDALRGIAFSMEDD